MIATQNFDLYPEFGNNATKIKPDEAKYAAGFQEADVLPCEWTNWFWAHSSKGITDLNTGLRMVEQELNAILNAGGDVPDGTSSQVITAIQYVIQTKTGTIADLQTTAKTNIVAAVNEILASFTAHATNKSNPHEVTKAQIGLEDTPNMSLQAFFDMAHPVKDKYIQFPGDPKPEELYNKNGIQSTWEDISSHFAGLSMRFAGGLAEDFNKQLTVQSKNGNKVTFTAAHGLTLGSLIVNLETHTQYSISAIDSTTVVTLNETPVDLQNNTTVLICQNDQMQGHKHSIKMFQYLQGTKGPEGNYFNFGPSDTSDPINDGVNGTPRTGLETRSKNATVRLWKRIS